MTRRGGHRPVVGSLAPISETIAAFTESDTDVDTTRTTAASAADTSYTSEGVAPSSEDPSPIYLLNENTGENWELTWPIWHLLSHGERKDIASRYGYKSIGEFEEEMTLRKAMGASGGSASDGSMAYDSSMVYEAEADPRNYGLPTVAERSVDDDPRLKRDTGVSDEDDGKPYARAVTDDENDNDDSSTTSEDSAVEEESQSESGCVDADADADACADNEETKKERLKRGGPFLLLPDETAHHILTYMDVDMYGVMALVSPHWRPFTRTEAVYKVLCERCYLNQSKRKALHVSRFGGSYRRMLETRPRVRTGGVYVLKYSKVKKIQRDMWTEIPVGAILESVYYRYMYFFEDGRVLYALTSSPPHEMIPRFVKMNITGEKDKAAVWGRYEVQRNNVTIWASHPWHDVRFELRIIPSDQKIEGARGIFTAMSFARHLSSASGNFDEYWSTDLVEYDVPTEYFRFLRDWRL